MQAAVFGASFEVAVSAHTKPATHHVHEGGVVDTRDIRSALLPPQMLHHLKQLDCTAGKDGSSMLKILSGSSMLQILSQIRIVHISGLL